MAGRASDGMAVTKRTIAAPVEAVLQRMDKPDASTSFWSRSDVRAALDSAPPAAFSVQFDDLPPMLSALCAFAAKAQTALDDEDEKLVDASAVPAAEIFAKYLSHVVTYGERKSDGIHIKSHTPAAPAP